MITIRHLTARARGLAHAVLAGLALSAAASAPALAEFRGGGMIFAYTETCAEHGWPVGRADPVRVSYRDREITPEDSASQLSIMAGNGVINITAWNSTLHPTENFRTLGGRQIFSAFHFWSTRPMVRVVAREITSLINPAGPTTLANARSVAMRVRIQNLGGSSGCAVTVVAVMRRVQ